MRLTVFIYNNTAYQKECCEQFITKVNMFFQYAQDPCNYYPHTSDIVWFTSQYWSISLTIFSENFDLHIFVFESSVAKCILNMCLMQISRILESYWLRNLSWSQKQNAKSTKMQKNVLKSCIISLFNSKSILWVPNFFFYF